MDYRSAGPFRRIGERCCYVRRVVGTIEILRHLTRSRRIYLCAREARRFDLNKRLPRCSHGAHRGSFARKTCSARHDRRCIEQCGAALKCSTTFFTKCCGLTSRRSTSSATLLSARHMPASLRCFSHSLSAPGSFADCRQCRSASSFGKKGRRVTSPRLELQQWAAFSS